MRVGHALERPVAPAPGHRAPSGCRAGASLVEVIVAVVIVGVGIAGVASLTAASARIIVQVRALDETYTMLQSFVDSAATWPGGSVETGSRNHPAGVLTWSVPGLPGAAAWVRFDHAALSSPIRIDFVVPASAGTP